MAHVELAVVEVERQPRELPVSLAAIFDLEGPILRAMDDQQRLAAQAIWINRVGEQLRRQPTTHADGPCYLFGRGQNGGDRKDPPLAETGDKHASRVGL